MIDYISTIIHQGKSKPNLGHLQPDAQYSSGWQKYWLTGAEKIEVWYNPSSELLRIQGSVAYFWKGHNFTCTRRDFREGIDFLENILQVDLWRSDITQFEFGEIMQVDTKPKDYIKHHKIGTGEHLQANDRGKDKGNFRSWNEPNVSLKMYDASRNIIMKQGLQRQGIIEEAGWNPEGHFLKWEAHYIKPEVLNQGRALILANLVDRHWEEIFKADLYNQYKRLIPMKTIVTPSNKKDLGSADIVLLSLAELQINEGISLEELKKILYDKINSIPDEVLTKADKDSRKRQIKAMLDKIVEEPESRWDLSEKLAEALKKDI